MKNNNERERGLEIEVHKHQTHSWYKFFPDLPRDVTVTAT